MFDRPVRHARVADREEALPPGPSGVHDAGLSGSHPEAVGPACAAVAAALTDPPPDDLGAPTPCASFDLRGLVEHFAGTSAALAGLGLGRPLDPDDPWGGGDGAADIEWAEPLRGNLMDIARGWGRCEAWTGEAQVGGSAMPRAVLGQTTVVEVLCHGWDVARALGRTVELDPAVAAVVDETVAATAELGRRTGAYGPAVAVPPGAGALDRALAGAGRDPRWAPTA